MAQKLLMAAVGLPFAYSRLNKDRANESSCDGEEAEGGSARQAICILHPEKGQTARGVVKFLQEHSYGNTKILGEF
jgi:hypothetical protein